MPYQINDRVIYHNTELGYEEPAKVVRVEGSIITIMIPEVGKVRVHESNASTISVDWIEKCS